MQYVRNFIATDDAGGRHALKVYSVAVDIETTGDSGASGGHGRIEDENGVEVDRINKGEYRTLGGVRLTSDDQARLDGSSPVAHTLPRFAEVRRAERLSTEALWERVRRGEYQAFRTRRGQGWEWRLLHPPASDVGREREEPHHHA